MSALFQLLYLATRSILCAILLSEYHQTNAFSIHSNHQIQRQISTNIHLNENPTKSYYKPTALYATSNKSKAKSSSSNKKNPNENTIYKIPDEDDTCIPFIDPLTNTFIECYADSIAMVKGEEYTVGTPCDSPVALCYFKGDGDEEDLQLLPIEMEDELMDEVFPVAAQIVEEEFGEELSLERTPQTLTLIGDLGDDDEEDDDEDDDDYDSFADDDEEDVEILLTFEHEGREYNLVRLLDPVLLVGRTIEEEEDNVPEEVNDKSKGKKKKNKSKQQQQKCILLTPQESDKIMPILEQMFFEQEANDEISF